MDCGDTLVLLNSGDQSVEILKIALYKSGALDIGVSQILFAKNTRLFPGTLVLLIFPLCVDYKHFDLRRGDDVDYINFVPVGSAQIKVLPVGIQDPKDGDFPGKSFPQVPLLKSLSATAADHLVLQHIVIAEGELKPYVRFDGGFLFLPTASGKCRTRIGLDGHSGIVFAFDLNKMMRAVQQFKGEPVLTMKVNNAVAPILIGAAGRSDFALVCPVRLSDRLMVA